MLTALATIAIAAACLAPIGAATSVLTESWWRGRTYLGVAMAVLGIAAAGYLVFIATWIHPTVGVVLAYVIAGGALITVLIAPARRKLLRAVPLVLVTAGIGFFYIAFLFLWSSQDGAFSLAQVRFLDWALPIDNAIPYLFAERIAAGESTHLLVGDWNGSDRPPLQAGIVLIGRGLANPVLALSPSIAPGIGFGMSVVAQLLWVPALFAALRATGMRVNPSLVGVAMVAATGTALVNTVYTWPKLLSAALVLVALTFVIDAYRTRLSLWPHVTSASLAMTLAALAHGAAVFAAPFVVMVAAWVLWRRSTTGWLRAVGLFLVTAALAYAPWMVYQRVTDPPGDRLLKWHLAGVIDPSDDRSFTTTLGAAYGNLTMSTWWEGRLANIAAIAGPEPFSSIRIALLGGIAQRNTHEFFATTAALSLSLFTLCAVLIVVGFRRVRGHALRDADRVVLCVLLASAVAIAAWALVMFLPGSTVVHQGSHVWIALLIAAPAAWIASHRLAWGWGVVAVQAAFTAWLYGPGRPGEQVEPIAIGLALGGASLVLWGAVCLHRTTSRRVTTASRSVTDPLQRHP